ncbi:MAG TPA: DUF3418 domain-containing protein, partial [Actinomycetes bacterium]
VGRLDNATKLALGHNPNGSVPALLADCVTCAADDLMARHGGPAWDEAGFTRLRDAVRAELPEAVHDVVRTVAAVLSAGHDAELRAGGTTSAALLPSLLDVRAQLAGLVHPGFVTDTGRSRLPDLLRYLRAVHRRLEVLPTAPGRDRDRLATVKRVQEEHDKLLAELPPERRDDADVRELRWMVEELRVSLFAQTLGTAYPVSEKRIYRAMDALDG